jgi:hypothetical protein
MFIPSPTNASLSTSTEPQAFKSGCAMSRGFGALQRLLLAMLAAAGSGGIALMELRGRVLGWRPCRRGVPVVGRSGRWSPAGDDKSLRRAIAGLVRRGLVMEVGGSRRIYALATASDLPFAVEDSKVDSSGSRRCASSDVATRGLVRACGPPQRFPGPHDKDSGVASTANHGGGDGTG